MAIKPLSQQARPCQTRPRHCLFHCHTPVSQPYRSMVNIPRVLCSCHLTNYSGRLPLRRVDYHITHFLTSIFLWCLARGWEKPYRKTVILRGLGKSYYHFPGEYKAGSPTTNKALLQSEPPSVAFIFAFIIYFTPWLEIWTFLSEQSVFMGREIFIICIKMQLDET